ncbi:hypothetical protein ACH4F6_37565 [Streptomyces sp. NPDC017936]|uniref:hypothetical protein n=1 Tax=Streptomyces sp. NPDC017936 TaxID=3365016 RepID=UPI00378859EC
MTDEEYEAAARGIDRIERARRSIDRRRYTDRVGNDWKPGEQGEAHPEVVGTYGKAVLDYSDDGLRFQVNGYTYDGHALYRREFASLDAALRNGSRVANEGPTPAEHVEAWNAHHSIGRAVRYWTGFREGAGIKGRTRSAATVLGGHTAVVWVTGHDACIALTHVKPIPETEA